MPFALETASYAASPTASSVDAGSSAEAWFGIAQGNGTLSPSGLAFAQAIALMRSPQAPTARVQIC